MGIRDLGTPLSKSHNLSRDDRHSGPRPPMAVNVRKLSVHMFRARAGPARLTREQIPAAAGTFDRRLTLGADGSFRGRAIPSQRIPSPRGAAAHLSRRIPTAVRIMEHVDDCWRVRAEIPLTSGQAA